MEIHIIKMTNGEELVAKIISENDSGITISKPFGIMPNANNNGLAVFPWSIATAKGDTEIRLQREHFYFHAPAPKEIAESYIQNTTGLFIGDKQLLCE